MAWEGSDRRDRLPADWPKLRSKALERDGKRCRWILPSRKRCPRPATDVDHVRPGDDHSLSNLMSLCHDHHERKTSFDNRRAKGKIKASKRRPPEDHPGRVR